MTLQTIDWVIIGILFLAYLVVGVYVSRRAGKNFNEFFSIGQKYALVAFRSFHGCDYVFGDTPNLVTDIVRQNGVSGNWVWWAFLLTGMLTVFVYARLWRRSGVFTDLEFYELRYGGKGAAFLRGFRALYLGFFFNVVIMGSVCLAAIKIGGAILGLEAWQTLVIAGTVTVLYSLLGGLRGVIFTDFVQFAIAMIGAVWAAKVVIGLPEVGGLNNLLTNPAVSGKLNLLPDFSDSKLIIPLLIVPLAVQWWSVWYPGAEPGGGGYVAQRMLAAKDEKNAMGATLLFNIAHYALRPWPWILVALASLIVFPDLASLRDAFPALSEDKIGHDLAYPAMMTYLPAGLLGLVVASLASAFMSTISTHLNWGSSYIVHDFYKRFINKEASDRQLVAVGRVSTVILMILACAVALGVFDSAKQAFDALLLIGAGTGLIFILRWFWWRINAWSEISAMVVSFLVAITIPKWGSHFANHEQLVLGVCITTVAWVIVTFLTQPESMETLRGFYKKIRPASAGWKPVLNTMEDKGTSIEIKGKLPLQILAMVVGCLAVYSALFATGYWIYGNMIPAFYTTALAIGGGVILMLLWKKLQEAED